MAFKKLLTILLIGLIQRAEAHKKIYDFTLKEAVTIAWKAKDASYHSHEAHNRRKYLIQAKKAEPLTELRELAQNKLDQLTFFKNALANKKPYTRFLNHKTNRGCLHTIPSIGFLATGLWLINYGYTNTEPFSFKNVGIKTGATIGGILVAIYSSKHIYKGLVNLYKGLFYSSYLHARTDQIQQFLTISNPEKMDSSDDDDNEQSDKKI